MVGVVVGLVDGPEGAVGWVSGAESVHETEATGAGREPSAPALQGVPAGTVTDIDWPVTRVAVIVRV